MKFAIRKLAITCMIPTALWQGPMLTDAVAQNVPSAGSKLSAGLPQRRAPKSQPAQAQPFVQQGGAPRSAANQAPQYIPQQQGGGAGGESDVQRELRKLYEKSGQEMPVMDLEEMDVPEPQPGVAPNSQPGMGGGQGRPNGQYAAPPIMPTKTPNFFERVFLGRKAAPPAPPPRPMTPTRPPQMNGVPWNRPSAAPNPGINYRPFQQPQQTAQPVADPRAVNVTPPNQFAQPQINPNPPATPRSIAPNQNARPVQNNAPSLVEPTPLAPLEDDPLMDNDAEESLEIEITPKNSTAPRTNRPGVIPAPVPMSDEIELSEPDSTEETAEAVEKDAPQEPKEDNPFSGLELSMPDSATPTITPNKAAATPDKAVNSEVTEKEATPAEPEVSKTPATLKEEPFFDDDDELPVKKPATPPVDVKPAVQAPAPLLDNDPLLEDPFDDEKPIDKPAADKQAEPKLEPANSTTPRKTVESTDIFETPLDTVKPSAEKPAASTGNRGPTLVPAAPPVATTPRNAAATTPAVTTTPRNAAPATTPRATTPRAVAAPAPVATNARTVPRTNSVVVNPQSAASPDADKVPHAIAPLSPLARKLPSVTATPKPVEAKVIAPPAKPKTAQELAAQAQENSKKLATATQSSGLKGFCPVALRKNRQLVEAKPQFNATYHGTKYQFSSAEFKAAFEKQPQLYAPAHGGLDGVALHDDEKSLPGTLDFAAWFQGRLYLFASREHMLAFNEDPDIYLDDDHETTVTSTSKPAVGNSVKNTSGTQPRTLDMKKPDLPPVIHGDDQPVFGDNLDSLVPLAPPANRGSQVPAPLRSAGTNTAAPTSEAARSNVPKIIPPPVMPAATPRGPKRHAPTTQDRTRNTPASYVAPQRQQSAPPRLINPSLRLAPPPAPR